MDNEILRILQDIYSQNNGYQDDVIHIYLQGLLANTNIIKESAQQLAKTITDPNNPQQAMVKILEEHRKDDNRREVETRNRRIAEDQRAEELNKKQEASNKLQEQQIKNDANYHKELKNTIKESNMDLGKFAKDTLKSAAKFVGDGTFQMAGAMVGNAERAGQAMMHLTSFGVNMENGASSFKQMTEKGIASVDTFTQMVSDNAGYISRLNAQGESGVSSFSDALKSVIPQMKDLGFSTEEQAKAVKAYLDNQKITRQFENLSQKERQAHMQNYMEQVDKLAHMMGVSREEIEKRLSLEKAESWVKMAANNPAMTGKIDLLRGMGIDSKKIAAIMGMPQIAGSEAIGSMIKSGESPLLGIGRNAQNADELGRMLSDWAKNANKGTSETAMTFANAGIGWSDVATQILNYNPNAKAGATGDTRLAIESHNAQESVAILSQSLGLASDLFEKSLRETRDYFKAQFGIQQAGIKDAEAFAKEHDKIMSGLQSAINNAKLDDLQMALNAWSKTAEGLTQVALRQMTNNTNRLIDFGVEFGATVVAGMVGGTGIKAAFSKGAGMIKNVFAKSGAEAAKQASGSFLQTASSWVKANGTKMAVRAGAGLGLGLAGAAVNNYGSGMLQSVGVSKGTADTTASIGGSALQGAAMGAMFGPIGMGVGAAIGGLYGWWQDRSQKQENEEQSKRELLQAQAQEQSNTQEDAYNDIYAVLSDIKNLLSGIQKVEVINKVKVSSGAMGTV